jgi:uncharacterized protein (TIGR03435 family)
MNLKLTLAVAIIALAIIRAQSTPDTPKFEVTSVKPCLDPLAGRNGPPTPGRLRLNCVPVITLIRQSYIMFRNGKMSTIGVSMAVEGGPAWINSALYSIEAKPQGTPSQGMMLGPMMQALLEDRFQLKLHWETREVPVYALTVASGSGSPKLPPSQAGSCFAADPDHPFIHTPGDPLPVLCRFMSPVKNGLDVRGVTMADFCTAMSLRLDRRVIDITGIEGVFDIHLDVSPADLAPFAPLPPPPPPGTPVDPGTAPPSPDPGDILLTIRSAVQKLGFKLESAKGPGEFLVIDHIDRPSEN